MSTIKTKKEMNLVELLEWIWKNDIKNKDFECKKENRIKHVVHVAPSGEVDLDSGGYYEKSDTFTVEVEEPITEDTVLTKILVKRNYDNTAKEYCNSKIKQFVPQYTKAIYIINDDLTMTLIWKNGKLVE